MWIMIAGPYRSGSEDPKQWKSNLNAMNEYAHAVFKMGHLPVIGVNAALPIIEVAGEEHYENIMMPVSLSLAQRCDALLRVGGPSTGADQEMQVFRDKGLPVYTQLEEIPPAT